MRTHVAIGASIAIVAGVVIWWLAHVFANSTTTGGANIGAGLLALLGEAMVVAGVLALVVVVIAGAWRGARRPDR
jgi:hypothetical protein